MVLVHPVFENPCVKKRNRCTEQVPPPWPAVAPPDFFLFTPRGTPHSFLGEFSSDASLLPLMEHSGDSNNPSAAATAAATLKVCFLYPR